MAKVNTTINFLYGLRIGSGRPGTFRSLCLLIELIEPPPAQPSVPKEEEEGNVKSRSLELYEDFQ